MKGRKKFLGIAVATCALSLGLAFSACGEESGSTTPPASPVTLENFNNFSENLALGGGYTLPEKVYDTNGNAYDVTYSVTTESGKQLGVIGNQVFVNYLEKYYVVGSVEVATGDIRTQTITLSVADEGNPWITFGDIATGQQGLQYTLPTITVHDDSGENITPAIKLYLLNGDEKGEEITTIDGGAFTPTVGGYYYIEASAEDSTGNTGTAYEVFYVRESLAGTNQIVSFKNQAEVDNNFCFTAAADRKDFEKKYIPEFAGEKDVVQVRYDGSYWAARFGIVPQQDVSESAEIYDNYTHVVVRMYTVKSDVCTHYWYDKITMRSADRKDAVCSTIIRQNEWVDYVFPISQLVDFSYYAIDENGQVTTTSTNASFIGHAMERLYNESGVEIVHKGVYYVAGVYVTNLADEVSTAGETLGESVTVSAKVNGENKDLSNATLRIKKPNGSIVKVQGNAFTPTTRGTYEITVLGDGVFGTTSVSFTGVDSVNELISFNYDSDLSAVSIPIAGTIDWVAEYQGKQGVLRYDVLESTSVWAPKLTFNFMQTYDDLIAAGYTDKDYVVVEMYVVSGDDSATTDVESFATLANNMYCAHGSGTKYATYAKGTTARYVYNAWAEYVIPLAFFDGWATGSHNFWGQLNATGDSIRWYIADIRAEKATLNVSTTGTLTVGETVVVSATDAEGNAVDMKSNEITTVHYGANGSRNVNANTTDYTLSQAGEVVFTVEKTDTGDFGLIILNVTEAPTE